jgi:acyl-coenzyme A synthetase/AMP-(fatty) acid ligase
VAIADPHEERIVVVAEVAKFADAGVRERVASDILAAAGAAGGPARVRVVTIPPRGLPRTTSGKWQRSLVAKLITDIWREHNHV